MQGNSPLKKEVVCILCIILGLAIILIGILVMNPETYLLGERDMFGSLIEFGGDFYTEIYDMTYSAANAVQRAYVNICNAIGWLIIALGIIDISYFSFKLFSILEKNDSAYAPQSSPASVCQTFTQAQKPVPATEPEAVPIDEVPTVKKENDFLGEYWVCGKCKTKNLNTRNDCWSCGNPK